MAAISDLIHNGANDLTGSLTGNLTGSTAPTPIQSGERRRALVARDLGLLHCCEGVASAFLGYYQEYGDVCQQGLQTMLDLCLDPTNRLNLGIITFHQLYVLTSTVRPLVFTVLSFYSFLISQPIPTPHFLTSFSPSHPFSHPPTHPSPASCQIEPIVREILRESTMTNTTTKKKGKRGRVIVALCDWLKSLTPCERVVSELYRLRYLHHNNPSHATDDGDDENNNNNNNNNNDNNAVTSNKVVNPTKAKINAKGSEVEYLSQVDQTLTHLLTLLYTSTPTVAPSSAVALVASTINPLTTTNNNNNNNNNNGPESFPLTSNGLIDESTQPQPQPQPPVEQQVLPLVGNLRVLRSLHATDLLVEVGGSW